jgi:hypothetical protein
MLPVIIAGQDDTPYKNRRSYKNRKKKPTVANKIVRSPQTTPWLYAPYGKSPHVMVGYGVMRQHMHKPWFSQLDFYLFQEKRFTMKRCNELTRGLVRAGYLEKRTVPNRTDTIMAGTKPMVFHTRSEYRTTNLGAHSITVVAKMARENAERNARRAARAHGKRGAAIRYKTDWDD